MPSLKAYDFSEYERIHNNTARVNFTRIIYILYVFYSKDEEEFIPPVIVVVSRATR